MSFSLSTNSQNWIKAITGMGASESDAALQFVSTQDSDYIYATNDVLPKNSIYFHIFNKTDGVHTIARKRSTTFSSEVSSLQVFSSSMVWMGVKSVL